MCRVALCVLLWTGASVCNRHEGAASCSLSCAYYRIVVLNMFFSLIVLVVGLVRIMGYCGYDHTVVWVVVFLMCVMLLCISTVLYGEVPYVMCFVALSLGQNVLELLIFITLWDRWSRLSLGSFNRLSLGALL